MARKISMGARREVVSAVTERYRSAKRAEKGRILDALCATTGWHRKHAVRALRQHETVGPDPPTAPPVAQAGKATLARSISQHRITSRNGAIRVTFPDEAIRGVNFGRRSPGLGGQYCRPNDNHDLRNLDTSPLVKAAKGHVVARRRWGETIAGLSVDVP
jgi:hypothetical protein